MKAQLKFEEKREDYQICLSNTLKRKFRHKIYVNYRKKTTCNLTEDGHPSFVSTTESVDFTYYPIGERDEMAGFVRYYQDGDVSSLYNEQNPPKGIIDLLRKQLPRHIVGLLPISISRSLEKTVVSS